MSELDIRGSGQSYAIYQGKARISRFYDGNKAAIAAMRGVAARLTPVTTRPCLCCGARFPSAGNGNRLCRDCRVQS